MTRQQIFLIVAGVLAVVLIYQLPRVVIENEGNTEMAEPHEISISTTDKEAFASLRQLLKQDIEIKKSINFADSLAGLHLKYQQLDSALYYARMIQSKDSSASSQAAMIYYRAFQMSERQDQAVELAQKARSLFEQLLVEDPQNRDLKNRLAMTLMTTENPMAGVQLLREVLEEDPENREAILNLGLLAIRSGQYDRAMERFERLLDLDSTDYESLFYYGVAFAESGAPEEAKELFQKLVNQADADPALKATASTYIEEL